MSLATAHYCFSIDIGKNVNLLSLRISTGQIQDRKHLLSEKVRSKNSLIIFEGKPFLLNQYFGAWLNPESGLFDKNSPETYLKTVRNLTLKQSKGLL